MYIYKHNNIAFSIATSNIRDNTLRLKVDNAIIDVFKGFLVSDSDNVQFEFFFTDNIKKFITDTDFVRVKKIKVGSTQTHFRDNELNFLIYNENPFKVIVNVTNNETIKSSLRIFDKAFRNNIERQVVTFYYRVFLLFSQLWNIQNGLSYLHSSAVAVNKESIIFTADSGVGKSSLLFSLSQARNFAFVADDLAMVSSNSKVFYQGRSLSIKPYHLKQYPFLMKKLKSLMSFVQKVQWQLLRDNRLTYRMHPSDLFQKISESSDIKRVVHLCNHTSLDFRISDLSATDLIKYTTPILKNELFLANHKLDYLASLPNSPFINSSTLYKIVSDIYSKAFQNVEIKLVLVPYMSDPNDLYTFLKSKGCLS